MTATGFAAGAALAKNGAGDANWVQAQQNGQAVRIAPGFAVGGCIGEKTELEMRIGSRLSKTDRR